jgi:chemotaxis protein CheC
LEASKVMLSEIEQLTWAGLVSKGINNAISGLSQMVIKEIKATELNARGGVALKDVPDLLGGPEQLVVGIYLRASGTASSHILVLHKPKEAFDLIDMLMGNASGTTNILGEMEQSALGEVGNIMGSFFLNSLSDSTGLRLYPSPPAVMMDMTAAILDVAVSEIIQETDEACVVETRYGTQDQEINGTFLVMPSLNLLRVLSQHWSK